MLSAFLCRLDPASWHSPVTNFSIVVSSSGYIFRCIRFIKVTYGLIQGRSLGLGQCKSGPIRCQRLLGFVVE